MTTPTSHSRRASIASIEGATRSRRASVVSDLDVYADEDAFAPPSPVDNAPLGPVPPPRQQFIDNAFSEHNASRASLQTPAVNRAFTAKQRLMIDDIPTSTPRDLGRSPSISSHFSIPRSQSPYNGPTAPSHPYNRYPQLTRSASVASTSTFRPGPETPFVPSGGPSQPYSLYTQNTVPEPDEDITAHGIPLGFPRSFQPSTAGNSSEVGDIIGSDGHIEQLPPYTRYADNIVAKGDMGDTNAQRFPRLSRAPATTSAAESSSQPAPPSAADSTTLLRPQEQFEQETESQRAMKEGWRETWRDKLRKNTFAGMPLWGLLVIIMIVIFSAIIGGVVGGIIGNKQGAERAYANGAVTTTIWLDAVPTTLDPGTSPLPTGHYQIPFNQSHEVKQCIPNLAEVGPAWGCMDIAYIGVNVFQDSLTNLMMAAFEDFSVNTQDFKYGPQPPDFNGTAFSLTPMQDKDAGELGVAMFFSVLFDKLTILPDHVLAIPAEDEKRSVREDVIRRDVAPYDGFPLEAGDKPWFCFWNSTINEFFVYVNQAAPNEPTVGTTTSYSSQDKYVTRTLSPMPTTTSYSTTTNATPALMQLSTAAIPPTPMPTSFAAYNPTPASATSVPYKRSYETSAANVSNYPKLIKMVEKRKPLNPLVTDYVQPYCQQMQVLDDWSIVPLTAVPSICIEEVQYTLAAPTSVGVDRRSPYPGQSRDVVGDLESFCICEWTSY